MKYYRITISSNEIELSNQLIKSLKTTILENDNIVIKSASVENRTGLTGSEIVISFIICFSASNLGNEIPRVIKSLQTKISDYKKRSKIKFDIEDVKEIGPDSKDAE